MISVFVLKQHILDQEGDQARKKKASSSESTR